MEYMPKITHSTFIRTSPEKVFQTLTTGEGWDAWFTEGTTIDLRPGGFIRLKWKEFGPHAVTTEDGGPILEVIPDKKFVFQWHPGESVTTVTFTLEPFRDGNLLTVTESGYTYSPKDQDACIGCAVGWGEALILLKVYLEHGLVFKKVGDPSQ